MKAASYLPARAFSLTSGASINTTEKKVGAHTPGSRQISRSESLYPDANVFNPERYLDGSCMDPREFVFGFGRRGCPGDHLAFQCIFMAAAAVLSTFSIRSLGAVPPGTPLDPAKHFDLNILR